LGELLKSRILLVDDHELVRKGIASLLGAEWDICGEAANGNDAVRKIRQLKPDLVVLDVAMPGMGGAATAREIRSIAPATKILFLSMHDSETVAQLGKLARVDACLNKDCSPDTLKKVVRSLLPPDSLPS
jgi:DNA-binding NarL/FixJ family response regulator